MSADGADFGSRLRAAREARGVSLRDIAATTKISVLVLEALERNDASRLPGGLFSRAFVRAYAKEVGLDPEQTVREFAERFGDGVDTTSLDERVRTRPSNLGERSHAAMGWLGLAVTVLLVIVWIGVDRYFSRRAEAPPAPARTARTDVPPPPPAAPSLPRLETPKAPSPLEPPRVPGAISQPGQAAQNAAPAEPRTLATLPGTAPAQPPVPPQAPAPAAGAPPTTEPARPAADLPLRIVLFATAPCWVSARVDDQRVPGRTLQPGEKLELSAAQAIVLTAGDAGALSYTINSAPGRSLGASGEVVTVVINTSNYRTFVTGRD
jgi:cytoskeleton protein RodZ